ncbi:hypothetical protein F4815DRAFT_441194 [Daldinia loculata]|nr:hypothetical protein F4815DRAFT_441194 [Daldinia loculata]
MYRQTLTKIPSRGLSRRAFTTTVRAMSAGDTGAPSKLGSLGQRYVACLFRNIQYPAIQFQKESWSVCPEMPVSPSSLEHGESTRKSRIMGDTLDKVVKNKTDKETQNSDAFQKREKANEDFAIRQREKEKLLELRKKLREQQDHLQKLSDHIDELTKDQGGEHN